MTTKQARKQKKCRCGDLFTPWTSFQTVCGKIECALDKVAMDKEKKAAKELRIARKRTREDKERIKTYSQLVSDAEYLARKYARLRDINEPCPSCGKYDHEIKDVLRGGKWDGGHFKGKGAFPELRLHPLNIHKQCKSCNGGSGNYPGKEKSVSEQFEATLRIKIGDRMVDYFKGPQIAQNWTHDELREIRVYYKEQIKLLTERG